MKNENESISSMNPEPTKLAGMPLMAKIFMIVAVLAIGGYFAYTKLYVKPPPPRTVTAVAPADKILFHTGEVVVAKCNDLADIGLYLESDITMNEYNATLDAVARIPSTSLVIPNQELTYNIKGSKLLVYKCQVSKGVLMGKLKKV